MTGRSTVDPARLSVFLDYDGTISTADVGNHLMARLAAPGWRALEAAYVGGDIGSRDCIAGEWALLPRDPDRIWAAVAEVALDPGFEPLVAALRSAGAEVTVVSDGFGFHVIETCRPLGIEVVTSDGDPATGVLRFPNARPDCPTCGQCGTCKRRPIENAAARGRLTVMVGDGTSDRHAARIADLVYATGSLADWCDAHDVPHVRFGRLDDVRTHLLALT